MLVAILSSTILYSCQVKETKPIDKVSWLLGSWQEKDSLSMNHVFYTKENDSVITESLFIIDGYKNTIKLSEKGVETYFVFNDSVVKYYVIDTILRDTLHFAEGEFSDTNIFLKGSKESFFKTFKISKINENNILMEYTKFSNISNALKQHKRSLSKINDLPPPEKFGNI